MKVYELLIVVNFLVILIVVLRKGDLSIIEASVFKILYFLWSAVLFLALLFAWIVNNVNFNFLTYQVF